MTNLDLRAWQLDMGYTYETAADALGMSRAGYAKLVRESDRDLPGVPVIKEIDKRTALACAAIASGIGEWKLSKSEDL